jgi:pimeloyl-ACP methyl ester carboxylesterase
MSDPSSGLVEGSPRLHYLEWNPGGAQTVVLLHGNSANAWWWQAVAEAMRPAELRMLALDLRGHGDSQWVRPPAYAPADYAGDLARFIRTLRLDRPIVAGHSMGGIAALAFAEHQGELARAVVAVDVAIGSGPRRNRYLRHLKSLPTVHYRDRETARARFRLMPNEGEIAPEILGAIAEHSVARSEDGRYTMKFDRESFFGTDGIDVAETIRGIDLPLLLVRAGRSRIMTAEAAVRATESNPLVRLVTIPDAHHHVLIERPQRLAEVISDFIAALPDGTS